MTAGALIAGAIIAIFVAVWLYFHKDTTTVSTADEKKVIVDFDAKKKAEATRIDAEKPSELVDDFNKRN